MRAGHVGHLLVPAVKHEQLHGQPVQPDNCHSSAEAERAWQLLDSVDLPPQRRHREWHHRRNGIVRRSKVHLRARLLLPYFLQYTFLDNLINVTANLLAYGTNNATYPPAAQQMSCGALFTPDGPMVLSLNTGGGWSHRKE